MGLTESHRTESVGDRLGSVRTESKAPGRVSPRRLGRILPNNYLCPLLQFGNRKIEFITI
jgi:hypothetical protein